MWISLIALVVAAGPISIRVGDVRATGIDSAVATEWMDRVATQLQRNGAVRLVKALGEGVLQGDVTQADQTWKVELEIRRTRDGSVWAAITHEFTSENAAVEWLEDAALDLEVDLRPNNVLLQRAAVQPGPPTWVRLLPAIAGVGLGAGAATSLIMSTQRAERIRSGSESSPEVMAQLQREQRTLEVTGAILGAAAAVGLASSVVWFGATGNVITVVPTASGAHVSVSGHF